MPRRPLNGIDGCAPGINFDDGSNFNESCPISLRDEGDLDRLCKADSLVFDIDCYRAITFLEASLCVLLFAYLAMCSTGLSPA